MTEPIIDYETGEIIETELKPAEDVLPRLARTLRALDTEIERLNRYKEQEVNRIVESVDFKTKALEDRKESILSLSRQLLEQEKTSFREYPGIGKFQVRKLPDSVDASLYESLPEQKRQDLWTHFPDLFNTKITVSPVKKEILSILRNGGQHPEGFMLVQGDKKLYFSKE